ncbi:hypothetical protein KY342_06490 [Candidatus Woesearchaeota archaeon]|nr:hypothetical protein [Candidatus Woesearchaeota archaeon]
MIKREKKMYEGKSKQIEVIEDTKKIVDDLIEQVKRERYFPKDKRAQDMERKRREKRIMIYKIVQIYANQEPSGRVYEKDTEEKLSLQKKLEKEFEESDKKLSELFDENVKSIDLTNRFYTGVYNGCFCGDPRGRGSPGKMIKDGVDYYKAIIGVYSKRINELTEKATEYKDKCIEAAGDIKETAEKKDDVGDKLIDLYLKLNYTKEKIDVYKNMIQKCEEAKKEIEGMINCC